MAFPPDAESLPLDAESLPPAAESLPPEPPDPILEVVLLAFPVVILGVDAAASEPDEPDEPDEPESDEPESDEGAGAGAAAVSMPPVVVLLVFDTDSCDKTRVAIKLTRIKFLMIFLMIIL